ncbi:MAG: nucleotide-diphospho-sugar transferase [bacterium]
MSCIDWPCEVKTYFRETNGGLRYGYSEQIDWFFDQVEEGIIFEDDNVPNPSFFPYCKELLERYRDNPRVMVIDGFNIRDRSPELRIPESYRFSRIPMCTGWGTWRRAWALYDVHMRNFDALIDTPELRKNFGDEGAYQRWRRVCGGYVENENGAPFWDALWVFAIVSHGGLCAAPAHNLVSNIGTGPGSTHNYDGDVSMNKPTTPMQFPLVHPSRIEADDKADMYLYRYVFRIDKDLLHYYIARPLRNMFPHAYQKAKKLLGRS